LISRAQTAPSLPREALASTLGFLVADLVWAAWYLWRREALFFSATAPQ